MNLTKMVSFSRKDYRDLFSKPLHMNQRFLRKFAPAEPWLICYEMTICFKNSLLSVIPISA